jgi:hypothetical protein
VAPGPIPKRPSTSTVVLTATAGVVAGIVIFAIVVNLVGSSADKPSSAAATFDVGPADQRARAVAEGGPILFQDLLGNSRDIYVQHLGDTTWIAVEAHSPGAARRCVLRWDAPTRAFVDPCDGRTYPADGTGLVTYPATVNDRKRVVVDLRAPKTPAGAAPSPTSSPSSSPSSSAVPTPG